MPARVPPDPPAPTDATFDVHGLVSVAVCGATPAQVAAVAARLGDLRAPLDRTPDLTIRFAARSGPPPGRPAGGGLRSSDDGLFAEAAGADGPALCRLPLDRLADGAEVVCESHAATVPLLTPLLNVLALRAGGLPLHAATWAWRGVGVAATGWPRSGKTTSLLAFLAAGATPGAPEWSFVVDDRRLEGLREPVRVRHTHLRESPALRPAVPSRDRARLCGLGAAERAAARLPGRLGRTIPPRLEARRWVDVPPERLAGAPPASATLRLDHLLVVVRSDVDTPRVTPMTTDEAAAALAAAFAHDTEPLVAAGRVHRFTFPGRDLPVLSRLQERYELLARDRLAGVPVHRVEHRPPHTTSRLVEALSPYCS